MPYFLNPAGVALAAVMLMAALTAVLAADGPEIRDRETFETLLQRAEHLNITAPWRESQAVLEDLRGSLDLADEDQYARFSLIEIRNLALDGRLDEALDRLQQLLPLNMPPERRLRALSLGANIAQLARRFRLTFRYLNQAMETLEDGMADGHDIYLLAATLYATVGERDRALEYGRLGLERAESLDLRSQCTARMRFGLVYRELGEAEESLKQFRRALETCRASGEALFLHGAQYRLADAMHAQGLGAQARDLFEDAIEGMKHVEYRFGLAEARLLYARLEAGLGRTDRVESLLSPAIDTFEQDGNWQYLAESYRLLAEAAQTEGELERALELFDRHMNARKRHEQQLRSRQTAFLEIQFDNRHTEHQLELLRERERVRELEAVTRSQRDDLRYWVYGTFIAMVAVLALLLLRASRERRRFQGLSERDALTALSNHTRFFKLAERTLDMSREKGIPYTLVLGDIDHFKQVNDRYGHQTGDAVLRRIAARLREHFSDRGIIGRIGGEEFGIALPGMDIGQAEERLQVLRRSLAESRREDPPVEVTMSFGVARPRDQESLAEIRERADRGLYQAKNAGRDRIVVVGDED